MYLRVYIHSWNLCLNLGLDHLEEEGQQQRNIIWWEKEWVTLQKIPKRKEREDSNLWMYNSDLNNAMRELVRT